MAQKVYAQLMTIYHPLEIQFAEFDGKKDWVKFFREHKYECYPLSLYLYDPLFDCEHTPFTYQFVGQELTILKNICQLVAPHIDRIPLEELRIIANDLYKAPVTHIMGKISDDARIVLSRLEFKIIENGSNTYVIDQERIL